MGVSDRDLSRGAGGRFPGFALIPVRLHFAGQVAASQTDLELDEVMLPANYDFQVVEASVYAGAVSGANAKTVNVQDDGVDMFTDRTVTADDTVAFAEASAPTRLKGGSKLKLTATTGATTTIDDITVTIWLRPYPLGEAGVAVT